MESQNENYTKLEEKLFGSEDGYFARREGFWKRQFSEKRTRRQVIYDVLFGMVAPVLCFYFDPIIFQPGFINRDAGVFARYALLVYLLSAIAITTLGLWLAGRLKKSSGIVSGILLSGALSCLLIGIFLLPLSILGLIFVIGIFGFVPFFTAFVYWRNGIRAWKQANADAPEKSPKTAIFLGVLIAIAIPLAIDFPLSRIASSAMQTLISQEADAETQNRAAARIKKLSWYIDTNKIMADYRAESNERRKEGLANVYRAITDRDIRGDISD